MIYADSLAQFPQPETYDILVVGAGAAGLYTALCIPQQFQVGLINKDHLTLSASDWAQGGIAAAISPEDSPQLHLEDTLKAGAGLCDPEAVQFLVEHAPECIHRLVEMGVSFDRHNRELALTLEAAHSRHRVLHAADTTGRAVVSILTEKVLERPNITVISPAFALNLWLNETTHRCQGLSLIRDGQVQWMAAKAVILATGGGGQVFSQTTNPSVSTGDGVAMAWRAGAMLRDLEFFQFHPTALQRPGAPHFLISEAVRGEGAHLIDTEGYRFAFDYHPAGELAPRDVVSRAIFSHLQSLQKSSVTPPQHVGLDLRPIAPETIQHRFPNIIKVCQKWGIDVFNEPIPVAPAAHYWMGGVVTNTMNQTSIPGLYAVGETASTGVHGANRLASNSLLECLVFGAQMHHLGLELNDVCLRKEKPLSPPPISPSPPTVDIHFQPMLNWEQQIAVIHQIRQQLPTLVWQSAGICRQQPLLNQAIARIQHWHQEFYTLPISQLLYHLPFGQFLHLNLEDFQQKQLRLWGETQNLLDISTLMLKAAAFRTESRGGHYRQDFPQTSRDWQVHTLIQGEHISRT
jgi:L-aspartate oxidase